jgi:hypothetical protein
VARSVVRGSRGSKRTSARHSPSVHTRFAFGEGGPRVQPWGRVSEGPDGDQWTNTFLRHRRHASNHQPPPLPAQSLNPAGLVRYAAGALRSVQDRCARGVAAAEVRRGSVHHGLLVRVGPSIGATDSSLRDHAPDHVPSQARDQWRRLAVPIRGIMAFPGKWFRQRSAAAFRAGSTRPRLVRSAPIYGFSRSRRALRRRRLVKGRPEGLTVGSACPRPPHCHTAALSPCRGVALLFGCSRRGAAPRLRPQWTYEDGGIVKPLGGAHAPPSGNRFGPVSAVRTANPA